MSSYCHGFSERRGALSSQMLGSPSTFPGSIQNSAEVCGTSGADAVEGRGIWDGGGKQTNKAAKKFQYFRQTRRISRIRAAEVKRGNKSLCLRFSKCIIKLQTSSKNGDRRFALESFLDNVV
ncbi:hypothetical protein TNCT_566971 [Trichonephila clavata]|uniref:Uncharacterized protein n=1 Tax=Trichonephila clavata TaxID=2740835 RepID=A0A8X6M3G6_TRICU|nr:hypothetical protein TNCT_566971 [Trichonephila clavata]